MKDRVLYQSRFSNISDLVGPKYLFFDFELQSMFNQIKECWSIIQAVKKRFDRKETCRLSKTQTEYMQLQRDYLLYPYVLYNFQHKDVTISIVQHKKKYYIYCEGYNPSGNYPKVSIDISRNLYSEQDCLSKSISDFVFLVMEFCNTKMEKLPF